MKKRLAICDNDERYRQSMQNYLMKRLTEFEILTFASLYEATEYSKKQAFAILLISESSYEKDLSDMQALQVFILKEDGKAGVTEYPYLEKYQSMEAMIHELLNEYAQHSLMDAPVYRCARAARVHTFYSPVAPREQTKAAFALGQVLSEKNHKVLYLNLQAFVWCRELFIEKFDARADITDLLYMAGRQEPNFSYRVQGMRQRLGGVDYFAPAEDWMDLLPVTQTEWQTLLKRLQEMGEYTDIILDLSEICQGLYDFLQNSDCIYSICARTREEQFTMEQYKRVMEKREMASVLEMTKWIELSQEWVGRVGNLEQLAMTPLGEYMKGLVEKDGNRPI